MSNLKIAPETQVTLHFSLKLDNGDVIDSNFEKDPATFVIGDGNMLEGFEKAMLGMQAGEEGAFVIKPEDGFGAANPNNRQSIPRDQFPQDVELVEGLMLSFADAQKAELPGVVYEIGEDNVIIDFNHPLAGRDIVFEVAIVDVQEAAAG